jgi:solute:Na+ symporter, SSS family
MTPEFPVGVLGLVLAGLLAAMMSSVSATFNSASTLVTMDFVRPLRPNLTSKQLVRVGQIVTLVLVVLASAWAPFIERFSSLWEYLQIILGFIAPPVVAVFILGIFWGRANATGAISALLTGFGVAIFMLLNQSFDLIPAMNEIHYLMLAFYLCVFCTVVHFVVSATTPPPPEEKIEQYTWSKKYFKAETEEMRSLPWYQNYRILAVILLVITAIVVVRFW